METTVIKISGMTCGGCVASVTGVLQAQPGVSKVRVSLDKEEAVLEYDPAKVNVAQLRQLIADAGYEPV
jgi:copper chaperone